MDPISTVAVIVQLGLAIKKAVDQATENKERCLKVSERITRLLTVVQSKAYSPRDVFLIDLKNKLADLSLFIDQYVGVGKKGSVLGYIGKAVSSAKDEKILHDFEADLDRAIHDLTLGSVTDIKEMVDHLVHHPDSDSLESMYVREPVPTGPNDNRAVLGKGTLGTTYRMKQKSLDLVVAVKVINIEDAFRAGVALAGLQKEARTLACLSHPHIVRYYNSYLSKKEQYFNIVMELVTGGTLASLVGREPRVTAEDCMRILREMTSALSYMHHVENLLHRDLKPDNVLLTASGSIKIADAGMAFVMHANDGAQATQVGTSTYSSYEKAHGLPYGSGDDMWAVGCILVELVTGVKMGTPIYEPDPFVLRRKRDLIKICKAFDAQLGDLIALLWTPKELETPSSIDSKEFEAVLASQAAHHDSPDNALTSAALKQLMEENMRLKVELEQRSTLSQRSKESVDSSKVDAKMPAVSSSRSSVGTRPSESGSTMEAVSTSTGVLAELPTDETQLNRHHSYGKVDKSIQPELWRAMRKDDVDGVRRCLASNAVDINAADYDGKTVLIWACDRGHKVVASQALSISGIDANKGDSDGNSALIAASMNGHLWAVSLLLKQRGIDVNAGNKHGDTALYWASRNGHIDIVVALLETPGIDVNKVNQSGWSPLIAASNTGRVAVVMELLKAPQVDLHVIDNDGLTALDRAKKYSHKGVISVLQTELAKSASCQCRIM